MSYPPDWRINQDNAQAIRLVRAYPIAHLVTSHNGPHATLTPFLVRTESDHITQLTGHLNGQNPQVDGLDGAEVLVVFSGPSTYVSPHWRVIENRAGTIDYEEVQVRGHVRMRDDRQRFVAFINELAEMLEPRYREAGDYPIWNTDMTPEGYIERLYPMIKMFEIEVTSVRMISKLHQSFPVEDRLSIAEHLERCSQDDARAIAERLRENVEREGE